MKRMTYVLLAVGVLAMTAACATTSMPNWRLEPYSGAVHLDSDFRPDPNVTDVTAGGSIDLSSMGYSGYVSEAPDLDLYYDAGDYDLYVYVTQESSDTVLLINDPNGNWHFSDDVMDTRPGIHFSNPPSGLYDIWVGTYNTSLASASVAISEISWERRQAGDGSTPNWELDPTFGSVELGEGFKRDPYVVEIVAGGSLDLESSLGFYGYVAEAPDFDLYYEGNDSLLYIYVDNASEDTVMLVNTPDGEWLFSDDGNGVNPGIVFQGPSNGLYDIWVGSMNGEHVDVDLIISKSSW